jgi:hypothetical protein
MHRRLVVLTTAAGRSTTSSTGAASFTAKPGKTVFASVSGKYAGTSASRKA